MNLFDFREPVSTGTHGLGFLLAWPAFWILWSRSRGQPLKQLAFVLFGFGMAACYLGSTLYHGVKLPPEQIAIFHMLDYIGIYLLIAGSISPVCLVLLRGRWRWTMFTAVWLVAAIGIGLQIFCWYLPTLVAVGLYLALGWSVILAFFELARVVSYRALHLAILGGVFYSVGAAFHVTGWPVLVPGIFGSHELFHVLVLCGTTCHFLFMLLVVAPFGAVARPAVRLLPAPVPERMGFVADEESPLPVAVEQMYS
jgi:hemolysin III